MREKRKNKNWWFWVLLGVGGLGHWLVAFRGDVVKNTGISFGLNGWVFLVLNILFILFLAALKNKKIGLKLMLVGGLINLMDRIFFGGVRDYWYFFGLYNNLADWLIVGGGLLFLVESLWKKK